MRKSKIAVAFVLSLLIVIQSMTVFAGTSINLGNVVVDSTGTSITGSTLTSDQSSVGQAVYYDYTYSGTTTGSSIYVIDESATESVYESTYSYILPDLVLPDIYNENLSVTAKVYDGATVVDSSDTSYDLANGLGFLYDFTVNDVRILDAIYGDIPNVRETIYAYQYGDNFRISMPFNTSSFGTSFSYSDGFNVLFNGQSYDNFNFEVTEDQSKWETVDVSVYNSVYNNIFHNYNLDVYLNKPGTATVSNISLEYPVDATNTVTPDYIWGNVSDPDSGNVGVDHVWYSLKNSSNSYMEYDYSSASFKTSVTGFVYNETFLTEFYGSDFYSDWVIPISSTYPLPDSTYTLTVFADDGADGTPITTTFTVGAPVVPNPDPGTPSTPPSTGTPSVGTVVSQQEPTVALDGSITLPAAKQDDKGNTVTPISAATLNKAIEQTKADADGIKTVKISVPKVDGTEAYVPEFPIASLTSATADTKFEISTELGTILIPANMLKGIDLKDAKKIGISIGSADTSGLSDELKKELGDKPVIDLKLIVDGKEVSWNNSSASVSVTVPYTLTASEALNPEFLTIWYIDDKGKVTPVPTAKYNKDTKGVTFSTTHFSKYALVYNEATFSDISASYAKKSIEVLAAKGITSGTGKDVFSPKSNVTRADFLVMLVKALGLTTDFDSNFSDVKSTDYFYNAVGIAKKLGIVSGTTSGIFDPRTNISRQDMMVMAAKAMKIAGKLTSSETDLSAFTDASSISDYAKDSVATLIDMGIVSGSGTKVMPTSSSTREQVAIVIYKIFNK